MSEPCFKCGVRSDIGCKHQPAEGSLPPQMEKKDSRVGNSRGQGYNFHRKKAVEVEALARVLFK